jgi:hypothetical protein
VRQLAVLEPQRLQAQQARGRDLGVEIGQRVATPWKADSGCAEGSRAAA